MRLRYVYLILSVVGAVLPYWKFIPWMMEHGLRVSLLFAELFSTRIGAFFGLDVIASAVTLFVFIFFEGRRASVAHRWLPIIATLFVGVSLGLPLFLFLRQRQLDAVSSR